MIQACDAPVFCTIFARVAIIGFPVFVALVALRLMHSQQMVELNIGQMATMVTIGVLD